MNNILTNIVLFIMIFFIFSCKKKYIGDNSIETVKYDKNVAIELDSIQTRNNIILIKLQEIYDLAINYAIGNKDSDIDKAIYNQMQEYFEKKDSMVINPIIKEIDSIRARFARVNKVNAFEYSKNTDTLDFASYKIDYYDVERKYLGTMSKNTQYILKKPPDKERKFKQEFKFYFVKFDIFSENDSILLGKIR